jgi:hypothetical protein
MLVYGCVCSGIGAATVAWEPLGWRPAWFSEILPFPGAVLKHRYPNVPNLGDMTRLLDNRAFIDSKIDNSMFDCHPFHNTSNGVTIPRRSPLGPTTRTGRPLERSSIVATESSSAHTGASRLRRLGASRCFKHRGVPFTFGVSETHQSLCG